MKSQQIAISIIILIFFHMKGYELKNTCGKRLVHHKALITNGFQSKDGDWPWHAAIHHFSSLSVKYKCGGTVLNSNTILTAAHCIFESDQPIIPERVFVHLGKLNLITGTVNKTQEFAAHRVIPHPNYSTSDYRNDIAIIRLSTEASFTKYVQPICLWDSNKMSISEVIGKNGTVVGWGYTEKDELSYILRQTAMQVVPLLTCLQSNQVFGSLLSENNFCAGFRNGSSACNGDSGGSIVFEENGVYRIRGIVSLTIQRHDEIQLCSTKDYVLFTDVAKYLPWIEEVVPQLKPTPPPNRGKLTYQLSGNVIWSSNCDFYGGDFKNQVSRKEDCGDICSNNAEVCTHFTWLRGLCLLKNIGNNPSASVKDDQDTICGRIVRQATDFNFHTYGSTRWSLNCGFSGSDIDSKKSSSADCATICEDRGDCTHFNWTPDRNGTCWLKGPGVISTPNHINDRNVLCGFFVSDWRIAENVRWNHKCDYSGDNIAIQKSSRQLCGELCSRRDDCYKFAWTSLEGGTCWLNGNNAKITPSSDYGTACGWVRREQLND